MSLFGVGGIIASVSSGPLIDRFGPRSVILVSLLATSLLAAGMAFTNEATTIALLVLPIGTANQAVGPSVNAMISVTVAPTHRRYAFSLMYVAINAGFSLGPALGGFLVEHSFRLIFIGEALAMAAAAGICYATTQPIYVTGTAKAQPAGRMTDLLRDRLYVVFLLLNFAFVAVYTQTQTTLPVVMTSQGYSPAQYGLLLTINGGILVLMQVPLDRATAAVRLNTLMMIGGGYLGVGFLLHVWAFAWWWFALAAVIWSLGELFNMPPATTVASQLAPRHLLGRYMGMLSASFPIGSIMGSSLGGVALEHGGSTVLWVSCGLVGFVVVLGRSLLSGRLDQRL